LDYPVESILEKVLHLLFGGGPQAIIAILVIAVAALVFERQRLIKEISRKDERIEKIVDDYHNGNLTLSEALYSLKLVLHEIKGRIQ